MGISSGKQTNKPVYNKQIEGAGSALTSAYNTAAPQIQQLTDTVTGLAPDIAARYREGDAGVNAARDYNVKVLSGQYLDEGNPHLQAMIDDSGNDLRNQMQAALGVRGLTGGSSYAAGAAVSGLRQRAHPHGQFGGTGAGHRWSRGTADGLAPRCLRRGAEPASRGCRLYGGPRWTSRPIPDDQDQAAVGSDGGRRSCECSGSLRGRRLECSATFANR
jgi:hypothetical protein